MKRFLLILVVLFISISVSLFPLQEEKDKENMPEVKEFGGFWYAYMDFHGPYKLLGAKAKIFREEFEKQGLKATGPLFVTFYNPPSVYKGYELRWAICYFIDKKTRVKKPIKKRKAPKVDAVMMIHYGGHKTIWDSFDKVQNYIKEGEFDKLWPAYEIYHDNPKGIGIIHPVKKKNK